MSKSPFGLLAREFILRYLSGRDQASGEDITTAAKDSGIQHLDDRAFGPIFMSLAKRNQIEKCGTCLRKKGHGTSGGTLWRLKQ